jgi:hypothetical protein
MMMYCLFVLTGVLLSANAAAKSPFAGIWEGRINDLPGVDLTVQDDDGRISGVIVFYFQMRGEDGKWRVTDKTSVPMLAPKIEGRVLTFETIHHKQHGGTELGPNNKYRVKLVSEREVQLHIFKDQGEASDSDEGLRLMRRESAVTK